MKNKKFTSLLAALIVMFLFACDKEENGTPKQVELQSVGFTGTLPGNQTFGDKNILSSNHVSGIADSVGGAAYLNHYLNIRDSVAGINIQIILPLMKYSNDFNPETDDLIKEARVHYSYQEVKNLLSPGNKPILSQQEPDTKKGLTINVGDKKSVNGYSTVPPFDQDGSQLKVIQIIEGTETDPSRGQVKTLNITLEVDVKLYPNDANYNRPEKFKGILRMKYREV